MEDRTLVIGYMGLYFFFLLLITSLKGRKYDQIKKKENSKYNEDHFGEFFGSAFHIAIPHLITEKTNNFELDKLIKQYNVLTYIFWISVIISVPILFWVY